MKKIILMLISVFLLTGCGKVDKDKLINDFVDRVDSSKAYLLNSKMELYSGEDTFSYDITVSYMDDDFFKVDMVNSLTNHEQVILRNNDEVYVVTPSLNKSYKFVSEWPYNSSQSYILNTLVKDIKDNDDVVFNEEDDGYSLRAKVNYPNHNDLSYEKLYFDNDMNLKQVVVYDSDDIIAIKVDFTKIDYKANLNESDFDINTLMKDSVNDDSKEEETASLTDIVYPLYIPSNTFLKDKEMVNTENGERAILTFNGDKNFVLIEETSTVSNEFEIIPVHGDPLMLSDTIGALGNNSLTWTSNDVNYYLTSNDLSLNEIVTIASSLGNGVQTVSLEK